MTDATETYRRAAVQAINAHAPQGDDARAVLTEEFGQVWDTTEVQRDYKVLGIMAPFILARRKSDGVLGTMLFQHNPRFYYSFEPE